MIPFLLLLFVLGLAAKKATTSRSPEPAEPRDRSGSETPKLRKMLLTWRKRGSDRHGSGDWLASRDNGKRKHEGVDYIAWPGDVVFAPFDGKYERAAQPYSDDTRYSGMVLFSYPYRVTVFYVFARIEPGKEFKKGDGIGTVQNLSPKYEGITNHIHVEMEHKLKFGKQNPEEYF